MTRDAKRPAPFALISSTLGTILVSVTAVWLATSANGPRPPRCGPPLIVPLQVPRPSHSTACRPFLPA